MRRTLVLLLMIAACSAPFRSTIRISQAQLQARTEAKFPIEKRALVAKLALSNPQVRLEEGSDRIGLELDASVNLPLGVTLPGSIGVTGRLAYDADDGVFYLVDLALERLTIPELPPELETPVRTAAEVALRSKLARIPVHRLKKPKELAAKPFIKSVRVADASVLVELGI